jgi:ribosomal protein S18 acetylase RimI-like enzyme
MTIRKAARNDIPAICTLYHAFFAHNAELQPSSYRSAEESGKYPEHVIASELSVLFLAVEASEAIGFIHVEEETTPPYGSLVAHKYAAVVELFVSPAFRREGIGTALLQAARQWAGERTLDYLELSVLPEAADAQRLYQKEGFHPVSFRLRSSL